MKDAYTNWRELADGNLTATETSAAIEIGAAPMGGHDVQLTVPERNANGDTLDRTFTQSATLGGSYALVQTYPQITGTVVNAEGGGITRAIKLANTLPFVKAVLTVGGATPDFGDVTVGLDVGIRENKLTVGN